MKWPQLSTINYYSFILRFVLVFTFQFLFRYVWYHVLFNKYLFGSPSLFFWARRNHVSVVFCLSWSFWLLSRAISGYIYSKWFFRDMSCYNVWVGKRDFVMVSNDASQNLDVVGDREVEYLCDNGHVTIFVSVLCDWWW